MSKLVYALHGFLGEGSDWSGILEKPAITPSYFSDVEFKNLNLDTFVRQIKKKSPQVFVGYSLGGRIGLQILEGHPELFEHYVFISTHPGLPNEIEKSDRLQDDLKWIEKLKSLPWDEFLKHWNQQTVLKKSLQTMRLEKSFDKDRLTAALSVFSLGKQKDYSFLIQQHQKRITWIVGDQDQKFLDIAQIMKQKKILLDYKRIFASHRILFDNPRELQELLVQLRLPQQA